jgi:hypothetical protein
LEVGEEGGFKLDLRQDPDPGKQKLKGAVRTETYQCHYCQQCSLVDERMHDVEGRQYFKIKASSPGPAGPTLKSFKLP